MIPNSSKERNVFSIPPGRNAYTCAAYIAHPHLDIAEILVDEKMPISEVLQVLLTNKVLFRSFVQYDSVPSSRKKDVIYHIIRNSKEMSHYYDFYKVVKNELLDVIRLLNDSVQTLFIKSSNIPPLDSDNFDVLIRDNEIKFADQVLRRNGFSVVRLAEEPYKVLYRKTKNGKDYLALHLHSKIAWGGVEFLRVEDVWKKYLIKNIEGTNVGFISPEHHVLVTLAHAFFENASLKLGDILYLVDSFSNKELNLSTMISSSMEMGWDVVFCAMLLYGNSVHRDVYGLPIIPANKLDAVFLEALSRERVRKIKDLYERMKIFYQKPYLPVSIPLRNYRGRQLISQVIFNNSLSLTDKAKKLKYLFSVFLRGTVPRQKPSIVVAFIGVDSTGKTTHARRLVDAFRKRGYVVSHVWSRGTFRISEPFIGLAASLLGSRSNIRSHGKLSEKRVKHVKTSPFFGKILTTLLLFEHATQLRSKLLLRRFSSNALIFDRYLHDTVVDSLLNYGQDHNSFFSRLFLNKVGLFASRPDLIVLLKASPHTIVRRRPEEDFKAVKLKSQVYEQWSEQWGAYVLDTERYTIEQNHLNLLEKTLRLFYEGRTEKES